MTNIHAEANQSSMHAGLSHISGTKKPLKIIGVEPAYPACRQMHSLLLAMVGHKGDGTLFCTPVCDANARWITGRFDGAPQALHTYR